MEGSIQFLLEQMDHLYHLGLLAGAMGLWVLQDFFWAQAEDVEWILDECRSDVERLGAELVRIPPLEGLARLGPEDSPVSQTG